MRQGRLSLPLRCPLWRSTVPFAALRCFSLLHGALRCPCAALRCSTVLFAVAFLLVGCARDVQACYAAHEGSALRVAQKEPNSTAWPVFYGELKRECGR